MITNTPNLYVCGAHAVRTAYSLPHLFIVIHNIFNKIERPEALEPFIVIIRHHWIGLQNYLHLFKNSRIKRYVPKQNDA